MDSACFPVILTYHSIAEGAPPLHISPALFADQMQWLHDHARVTTLDELVTALFEHSRLPERTVVLTFDDGYRDFYSQAAPVLRRLQLPATIFLATGFCGSATRPVTHGWRPKGPMLDWTEVTELAHAGFQFGAHTITHAPLPELEHEQANHEIAGSKLDLERHIGQTVDYFAYPYGRWSSSVRELVRRQYRAACATGAGVVQPECDPFALPRIDAHYLRTPAAWRMLFTAPFLAYIAMRRLIRRIRRQPEGIYARQPV